MSTSASPRDRLAAPVRHAWERRPDALDVGDQRRYGVALAALAIGDAAYAFQQTAVIPAFPTIQRALHAPETWTAWLLTGYLIVASIAAPLIGRLGDRHGKRRLLVIALAVFLLGSIGAALAPGIATLIVFRALQGVGGAVFPLSFAVVRDEFPPERVGGAIGLLTGFFGVGSAAGLGLGGLIAGALSWRWIFAVGAVTILLATVLVELLVPRSPHRAESRLDGIGATLLGGGLAALLVALTEGPRLGWGSAPVVGLLVVSVVLIGALGAWERRVGAPIADLTVLRRRPVLFTNLASLVLGYVLFGTYFLVPSLVDADPGKVGYGFGVSAAGVGLLLLPSAVGQLVGGPASGWLGRRLDPKLPFALGMGLVAAGAATLAAWHGTLWQVAVAMLVLGAGFGLALGPAGALIAQSVSATESGVASALNSVVRRVGGGVGAQIGGALLAAVTLRGGAPSEHAFVVAFWIGAGVALAGTACALLVPRGSTS